MDNKDSIPKSIESKKKSQNLKFFLRLLLGIFFFSFLASLLYSRFQLSMIFRVWKTAFLWSLNNLIIIPFVFFICKKISWERFKKPVFFFLHFIAALFSAAASTGLAFLDLYIFRDPSIEKYLKSFSTQYFHISFISYTAIAGIIYFYLHQKKQKENLLRETRLKQLSQAAELKALKSQINPHFLFNTLNSINALVHQNPELVRKMIINLGDMLRYLIDKSEVDRVSLSEEIKFVKKYLEIEKIRFSEQLDFKIEVQEGLDSVQIPPISIQLLVNNSIKHGIGNLKSEGLLQIEVREDDQSLCCLVRDNGPGLIQSDMSYLYNKGTGLKNLRDRLQLLYQENFKITVKNLNPEGCQAELIIPLKKGVKN